MEKFAQGRERQQRKKRNVLIGVGAALAVIAVLCLWYTRPQKLTQVLDGRKPVRLSACLSDENPIVEDNGRVTANIDTWLLNGVEEGDAALDGIWLVLDDAVCRASLRSLIPRGSYDFNAPGVILLSFVWEDQSYRSLNLGSGGELTVASDTGWDIYRVDPAVFDALAAVIQAYGEFQK